MAMSPRIALQPASPYGLLAHAIETGGGCLAEPSEADALIWTDPQDASGLGDLLDRCPSIRWVQLPWAGIEPMVGVIDRQRLWTCGKGVYADEVAEHALALALAGLRRIAAYSCRDEWSAPTGRSLFRSRVTVLGGGGVAGSLTRLLSPFGCHLSVLRRQLVAFPNTDFTGTLGDLSTVLPSTDLLVVALSLTPETTGIVDEDRLRQLPRHAWVVNVARGQHIVTDDLVDALRTGRLGGAALDVTDPEPLPRDHPLWELSNCIITPHTASTPEMGSPQLAHRVTENVRRFAEGRELVGLVDIEAGY